MKFNEWVASYSGCDGGSPEKSKIWFAGIEWGFSKEHGQSDSERDRALRDYHSGDMYEAIKTGFSKPHADHYDLSKNLNYTFGINSTKLIAAINGYSVDNYQQYVETTANTDIFKLNLYPIALPNVDDELWLKFNLQEFTNLSSKREYRDFCADLRFPFLRSEIIKFKPALILCTGISYVNEFSECFIGRENQPALNKEIIIDDISPSNKTPRSLYWAWINDETLFVVVPFPMYVSGLNSSNLQQKFGVRIKQILEIRPRA